MGDSHLAGPDKIQTINMSQSELLGVTQRVRGGGKEYLYSVVFVRAQQRLRGDPLDHMLRPRFLWVA